MIITYLSSESLHTLHLPAKVYGRYWLHDRLISIDGQGDTWVMSSTQQAALLDDKGARLPSVTLEPHRCYTLALTGQSKRNTVLTEPVTPDRQQYTKYAITANTPIRIGKNPDNDIAISNLYISDHHAQLKADGTGWQLSDSSVNGTFVNGLRVTRQHVKAGDQITFVGGCKIIIGVISPIAPVGLSCLAVNNPDQSVAVTAGNLRLLTPSQLPGSTDIPAADSNARSTDIAEYLPVFSRSPLSQDHHPTRHHHRRPAPEPDRRRNPSGPHPGPRHDHGSGFRHHDALHRYERYEQRQLEPRRPHHRHVRQHDDRRYPLACSRQTV